MNLIPAARILSECGILYSLLLILPISFPVRLLIAAPLLGGLGCSLAAAASEKPVLRCLCAAIPLASLLIPAELLPRCILALPAVYSVLLIVTNHIYADAWLYARHVKLTLPFELLLLIIGCTLRTERAVWLLLCGNVYFLFGVYYQHQLRLGSGVGLGGRLRDLASISILPMTAAAIVGLISVGLKPIGHAVVGFTSVVGAAMRYVVALATNFYHNPKIDVAKLTTSATEWTEATLETTTEATFPETWPEMQMSPAVFRGLLIAAGLLLLGLLAYGLYRFEQRPVSARRERSYSEDTGTVTEHEVRTAPRDSSNRRKVRKAYFGYLRLLQSRGLFRKTGDTSQEILQASHPYANQEKGSDLRRIYIRARYHTAAPVSDSDVREASDLLKELKKEGPK